jgi:hypothetical protein
MAAALFKRRKRLLKAGGGLKSENKCSETAYFVRGSAQSRDREGAARTAVFHSL